MTDTKESLDEVENNDGDISEARMILEVIYKNHEFVKNMLEKLMTLSEE